MPKPSLKKSGDRGLTTRLINNQLSQLDGFPCFVYEADSSLRILRASANVGEIVGIDRSRMIGASWLFDECVVPADRALLQQKFLELKRSRIVSLIHRLIDDSGRIMRVGHSLQRLNANRQNIIRGSILPVIHSNDDGAAIDIGFVSKFLHKIGNHFQLLHLIQHSIHPEVSMLNDLELIQETTEKAIDLSHTFSAFLQQPTLSTYVNLSEFLESIIESRIVASHEKNLDLVIRTGGPLRDAILQGDPEFLELAICAVLDNAIDESPISGSVLIKISIPSTEVALMRISRTLIIEMSHDGSGLVAESGDPNVEPFQTNKLAGNRMGLGLACRYIEMHGGLLRIHKREDRGRVVEITLPVALIPHARTDQKIAPSS